MAMNSTEMKAAARQMTIEAIMPALQENNAIKFADASFAILQTIEDQDIWCEVTVKTKAYKDTKVSKAFDPHDAAKSGRLIRDSRMRIRPRRKLKRLRRLRLRKRRMKRRKASFSL